MMILLSYEEIGPRYDTHTILLSEEFRHANFCHVEFIYFRENLIMVYVIS